VLINSCRHRGNAVCRAEEGHSTSFMCTYHGWTYDLKGNLVGVPGFKEVYHEELDRANWGLAKAPQVESYKGFIFACMDANAPGLYEYLGEGGRWGMDLLAEQGDMVAVPGVHKFQIDCNWKFPSDNTPDHYHGAVTHLSASRAGHRGTGRARGSFAGTTARGMGTMYYPERGVTVLAEYGHGTAARYKPDNWQEAFKDDPMYSFHLDPDMPRRMGQLGAKVANCHLNVFPNLFVPGQARNVALRLPKGPRKSEIWMWTFIDRNWSPEVQEEARQLTGHHFGPGGLMEQDDGENWDQSTAAMPGVVSGRYPLNYQMNLGRGDFIFDESGPPYIGVHCSEHAQLWTYRAWSEFMAASDWDDLRAHHSKPEELGRV
jgi:phenylpropionate dioxygenase-like ring-hydroxylating dioxygenase large terminal subunit